jgi:hypothetical protein
MRKGNKKEWKISSVLTADISGRKIMKRDHLAIGCQDVLMIFLPVKRKSTKTLTVTLSGRKEDTMTRESFERAKELDERIADAKARVNALLTRMGAGPSGVKVDHIKLSGYTDEEGGTRLPERFCGIPEEVGVKIVALLRDYYSKELAELQAEWEAL